MNTISSVVQFWVIHEGRSTFAECFHRLGENHGVSTWLIDQHIKSTCRSVAYIIDFEGSSIPGLKRFYSGFGAKDEPFHMHVENQLPFPINLLKSKSTR